MLQKLGSIGVRFARKTGIVRSDTVRNTALTVIGAVTPDRMTVSVGQNLTMKIDPSNPAEILYLFDYSAHEAGVEDAIRESVSEGSTFLDVGGFIGYYTLVGCEEIKNGNVITFEPFPEHRTRIQKNLSINGCGSVVEAIALSDQTKESFLDSSGSPTLAESGDTEVNMMRLDDYVDERKLDSIDVMKVDVEGAEHRLIEGGIETLESHEPTLILELHPEKISEFGSSVAEFLDTLSEIGYQFKSIPSRRMVSPDDFDSDKKAKQWLESNPHLLARVEQ